MGYEAAITADDLRDIEAAVPSHLALWGIAPTAGITLLNHSENTTFRIDAEGRSTVLRVHRVGYHTRAAIAVEIDWVSALRRDTAIRTAAPIVGRDGEAIQTLHTGGALARHAVMFEFLEGREPDEEHDLAASFERLGEITAVLHEHSRKWTPTHLPARPAWNFDNTLGKSPIWGRWRDGIGVTEEIASLLERAAKRIHARLLDYGSGNDRFGLIHADLRLANLLIHEDDVSVIDFDDCGWGWFMYDLGSALSFIEHKPCVPGLIAAWTSGYEKIRTLTEAERAMIPTFVMLRRILLVAWLGSHSETELAARIGQEFALQTCGLADAYLAGKLYA